MKGKIMAQRVVLATCLVVTLASLSLAGHWHHRPRPSGIPPAAAEAIRLMADQTTKAQASQQDMLKQLHEMSETIRSTRSRSTGIRSHSRSPRRRPRAPRAGV